MSAAVKGIVLLDTMSDDTAVAMCADGRKFLNGALETIEGIGFALHLHFECLVVVITALNTLSHGLAPLAGPLFGTLGVQHRSQSGRNVFDQFIDELGKIVGRAAGDQSPINNNSLIYPFAACIRDVRSQTWI